MKHFILLTFLLMSSAFAETKAKPLKKNEVKGGIVINESLQKLMDIEGVKPMYENCKSNSSISGDPEKLMGCLWTAVSAKPDLKEKVLAAYNEELKVKPDKSEAGAGRAPASTEKPKSNLTGRNLSSASDLESDPAVIGLSKFYGKKLDEIFDRDNDKALSVEDRKKGIILATNHRQFIELYKSELGKTIISAFTSYCLDTDPSECNCTPAEAAQCVADKAKDKKAKCQCAKLSCTINSSTREADRKKNIEDLQKADLSSEGPESTKWISCIARVPEICKAANVANKPLDESEKRSCMIMDYVEAARKNILVADEQKKFYDDLDKTPTISINNLSKEKASTSDEILKISSEDVNKALEEPIKKDVAEFETCFKNNQIINEKACEKFLSVKADDNEMAIAEMAIRQNAQADALDKELSSSQDKIKDYLKEEGYTAPQIAQMTEGKNIDTVKDEIMTRFKNKKAAIIAEMAEKIKSKTSATEGKIDNDSAGANVSKLQKIRDELNGRKADLSGLVKFSNIVSSYLQVKSNKTGDVQRNTASLFGEINSMSDAEKKTMQEKAKQAKLQEIKPGKGETQTNLDMETINEEFLEYSTLKKKD